MKKPTQLFPYRFPGIPCDIFGCYARAKWVIGRPDGPLTETFKLCEGCTDQLLTNLPDELVSKDEAPQETVEEAAAEVKVELPFDTLDEQPQETTLPITKKHLESLTYKDLKKWASEEKIPGYSNMNKEELVVAIHSKMNEGLND